MLSNLTRTLTTFFRELTASMGDRTPRLDATRQRQVKTK